LRWRDISGLAASRQRLTHQRAVGTFGKRRRPVETKPRQAFLVGSVRGARQSLPQESRQTLWRSLRILQELQGRDQALLGVSEGSSKRKRWRQAGVAGGLQRAG